MDRSRAVETVMELEQDLQEFQELYHRSFELLQLCYREICNRELKGKGILTENDHREIKLFIELGGEEI